MLASSVSQTHIDLTCRFDRAIKRDEKVTQLHCRPFLKHNIK